MLLIVLLFVKLFAPEMATTYKEKLFTFNYEFNVEWLCTKNVDGIALFERWVKINDTLSVRERKGELIVNCNYAQVVRYLSQYQTMMEWMNNVAMVERIANPANDDTLVYLVFGLPWPFDNRDLAGRFTVYHLDNAHCVVRMNGVPDAVKPHKGRVRIKNYQASWSLVRLDNNRTKIELYTFSDEPPLVPLWLQDPVVRKVFFGNLLKLKKQLEAPKK